jgi:GMP synthase (glutamine-hydrolysing)
MKGRRSQLLYRAGEVLVLRHVSWEGVGAFGERLDARGVPWRYVDLFADQPLPDLRLARALLIMGGPMGVYEAQRYPFLRVEIAAIREAVRSGCQPLGSAWAVSCSPPLSEQR